ncbi:MAG: UBP-type zinc finger domain-containing protein [Actinobacteria bacterium]|nr:UBP-type zinc finger domain-containing protein [Actinomycetota bacterium]
MSQTCAHLNLVSEVEPSGPGCFECLQTGGWWVHLRMCMSCGHIGCCDQSPNRHARAHWQADDTHPLVRSFEPGEDWWWCYPEDLGFYVPGAAPAPSHP